MADRRLPPVARRAALAAILAAGAAGRVHAAGSAPALGPVAAPAPAPAGLLAAVMARLATVQVSRARFTEQKTLAALTLPLSSSGRLAYRRPDRLEKITDWPRPEVLVVRGHALSLSIDGGPPETLDLAARPEIGALVEAILGTLAGDLPGLRRWYHVAAAGAPDGWHLTLTPRADALARLVRRVTIAGVDDGTGARIDRITTEAANGDRTVMTIRPAG